ncbi:hypothetical protein ASPCAL02168 [Aspergillus calidoustus]|uniref:Cell surface protein n=1 Tax=Aspergillus calidoustus TaxID=454130 RepID=A0A0U5HEN5_ASPCI|nr:hypothetical protein ASPCAL02168 [Aspergillus calidoustus]
MKTTLLSASIVPLLLGVVSARTDLAGCISSATTNQWHEASMIWYVPGTGEICDIPDCGGGRAPPKYDNPACPAYTGTATYEPSYLEGYGPGAAATTTTVQATETAPVVEETSTEKNPETTTSKDTESVTFTKTSTHVIPTASSSVTSPAVTPSVTLSSTTRGPSTSTTPSAPGFTGAADFLRVNAGLGAAGLVAALLL